MSNLFRANWKKTKKGDKRKSNSFEDQNKTSRKVAPPPLTTPQPALPAASKKGALNESPVHMTIACTPPSPLVTSKAQAKRDGPAYPQTPAPSVTKVTVYEDLRQDIINTTADVQKFLCAVSKLKESMEDCESTLPNQNQSDEGTTQVMDSIKQIIQTVRDCLDAHPGMQSTQILNTTTTLSDTLKSCNHRSYSACVNCSTAIDQLIDSFSTSIAAYMTGDSLSDDQGTQAKMIQVASSTNLVKGFSKSHESLQAAVKFGSMMDLAITTGDPVVDEIDRGLAKIEQNVQVAAGYVKAKLRYHQEVVHYFSKRAQLEFKHHQKMEQLCKSTEAALQEIRTQEQYVPLDDTLSNSMDVDRKVAASFSVTYSNQTTAKLIEPLEKKNEENDKIRKDYQQRWQKELKKLTEAKTALKTAQTKYRMLGNDLFKVRNLLAADPFGKQADKRKKEIYELELKWEEAESSYKHAVAHCNDCQYQVHVTAQKSILFGYRRMVIDMDTMLKNGLSQYCSLQENMFKTLPESLAPYKCKMEEYEIGKDFVNYIGKYKQSAAEPEDFHFVEYDPASDVMDSSEGGSMMTNSVSLHSNLLAPSDDTSIREKLSSPIQVPPQAWDRTPRDEIINYTSSPLSDRRKPRPRSVAFIGQESPSIDPQRSSPMRRSSDHVEPLAEKDIEEPRSKSAYTHRFKRLRTPAKCRQCDTYVYFNGYECDVCGLACHNLCLEQLMIKCGNKKLPKKISIFGVPLQEYLEVSKRSIPIVVTKCINELDERGLSIQGVYRISSAKSKLDKLCQLFESGADRIDLSEVPPHLVGSCLKFYFRQLPEPLLTFDLYHEFIAFAKEATPYLPCDFSKVSPEKEAKARDMLARLKDLLNRLPPVNYLSMTRLLYHLHRVGHPDNSKVNFMPPSNLGIVFGPNLLRQREMVASLALLADMTVQAKAIEILITHIHDVCVMTEDKILEMGEEQSSTLHLGETEMPVDVEDVASPTDAGLSENEDSVVLETQTSLTTPPERRRQAVNRMEDILAELQMASPPHTSPPGTQSFNYQIPGVAPNDPALQLRRSYNSIASPGSSLAPVFERQLENELEDSYEPETGSPWDGEEASGPGSLPLATIHSSGSLSGYTTSESLNDFDTYEDMTRRTRGMSDAPLNPTHSVGFRRSVGGMLPVRRHLSCSVGALDRIVEPVSREFVTDMAQILMQTPSTYTKCLSMLPSGVPPMKSVKPSSAPSSSSEEDDPKEGGDTLCEPESVPTSPASFSVYSSEENTPVHLTVGRRRSYEMTSDGVLSSSHPKATRHRPHSSETFGYKSGQERLALSATSSPMGSMRREKTSSCSDEQLVTAPVVKKLSVPSKYMRYEQPLLPNPTIESKSSSVDYQGGVSVDGQGGVSTDDQEGVSIEEGVSIDNQEGVSIDNQEGVSIDNQEGVSIDNQEGVSIDNQEGVSIDNQEGVSIDDQEGVSTSDELGCVQALIGEEDVLPLPDDSASKPLRVQSLFHAQDFDLGGSHSTGGFPTVRSHPDVMRDAGDSPSTGLKTVPPEQSHTPLSDFGSSGDTTLDEECLEVNVSWTSPGNKGPTPPMVTKEISKEESVPTPGDQSTENAIVSTNQPMEVLSTLPQQPIATNKPLGEAVAIRDTEDLGSQEVSVGSTLSTEVSVPSMLMMTSPSITAQAEEPLAFTNESTQVDDKGNPLITSQRQDTAANCAVDGQVAIETNHPAPMEQNRHVTVETGGAEQQPVPIAPTVLQTVISSATPPLTMGGALTGLMLITRSPPIRVRTLKVTPSTHPTSDYTAEQKLEIQCSRVRMISPEELREPIEGIKRSHTHESFVDELKTSGGSQWVVAQGHAQPNKKITVLSVKQSTTNRTRSPSFPTVVVTVDSRRKSTMTESDAGKEKDKPSPKTRRKTRTPHFV